MLLLLLPLHLISFLASTTTTILHYVDDVSFKMRTLFHMFAAFPACLFQIGFHMTCHSSIKPCFVLHPLLSNCLRFTFECLFSWLMPVLPGPDLHPQVVQNWVILLSDFFLHSAVCLSMLSNKLWGLSRTGDFKLSNQGRQFHLGCQFHFLYAMMTLIMSKTASTTW